MGQHGLAQGRCLVGRVEKVVARFSKMKKELISLALSYSETVVDEVV